MSAIEGVLRALDHAGVRHVVVGGVAVVLQGHARLTADLDLVIDLEPGSARRAMQAFVSLGLRPRAPVQAKDFADPATRRRWIEEKGMRVFSLWDPQDPLREVDVFVEAPLPFEELWERADRMQLADMIVRVASLDDLIAMKRAAGRPEDLLDIEALRAIQQERSRGD